MNTRKILITGCDRGLGLALAEHALAMNCTVFLTCLDPHSATVRALNQRYPDRCEVLPLDVTDPSSVEEAVKTIRFHTESIDWLVNNAAILGEIERSVGETDFQVNDVERVFRVNTVGALRVTHAFWDFLVKGMDRLLVNVSSEAGSIGQNWRDRWFGYSLSKAALNMQGALIHQRLRPLGGRVMQVHPGYVRTYMHGTRNDEATYEPAEAARLLFEAIELRQKAPVLAQPDYFDLHGNPLCW